MSQHFGGNSDVKCDPIWIIAARNNEKEAQRIYRINGERVSKEDFEIFKSMK